MRLCFGTMLELLYQARNQKVTNKSICDAIFKCYGYSVEDMDSSTPGHLKSGKINVPPDIVNACLTLDMNEAEALFGKYVVPLIKISYQEALVRALKAILREDAYIDEDTIVGYVAGYEKSNLLSKTVFCLSSVLTSVFRFVICEVKNADCKAEIKDIPRNFIENNKIGERITWELSDAKPHTEFTLTLKDPDFNRIFQKVTSMTLSLPTGPSEIEFYRVADVGNLKLRFKRLETYLLDNMGSYVFSRSKASRYEKSKKQQAIGTHALLQFLKEYEKSRENVLGDFLLYIFMEQGLNAPKILSKIEIDDSSFLPSKSDGVYLLTAGNGGAPYDQLVFGAADVQEGINEAVDTAFDKIKTIQENEDNEFQTVETTCLNDIYDDKTKKFMVDLILRGKKRPDSAYGIFLGYSVHGLEEVKDKSIYCRELDKRLSEDIQSVKPYIVKKITDEGLGGYNFYFYVIPFNDAKLERTQIIDEMLGGV